MPTKITTKLVKELRNATGISVIQCKHALEETEGDMEKALAILKKASSEVAQKKADRELGAGYVEAYIHGGGRIGAMIELDCETDFVAKNEVFRNLAKEIAMQVAATNPADLTVLLEEPFIKNPDTTIAKLIEEAVQKTGERIKIENFARFEIPQK